MKIDTLPAVQPPADLYEALWRALPRDEAADAHAEATRGFPEAATFEDAWAAASPKQRERAVEVLRARLPEWFRPPVPGNPGNVGGLSHGAFSARQVEPRAQEFADAARQAVPWLADNTYARAVIGWARAEARCDLLAEYLEEHGLLDADGNARPAADLAAKFERQAADARARLGLDPTSRIRLERDLAEAGLGQARLSEALAEGRRIRAEREVGRDG